MGASCTRVTPPTDEDQETGEQPAGAAAKYDEDEGVTAVSAGSSTPEQPGQTSETTILIKRQQSTMSTSSLFLNSLTGGGLEQPATTTTTTCDTPLMLQPSRRPSHRISGPIGYRLQLEEKEEEGSAVAEEASENRADQSLVHQSQYLAKSASQVSSYSGRREEKSGGGGGSGRNSRVVTVAKSKLQVASSSTRFQLPGKRPVKRAVVVNSSSTSSSSSAALNCSSSPKCGKEQPPHQEAAGKRTFSRLSVDSEKTIYLNKKKSSGSAGGGETSGGAGAGAARTSGGWSTRTAQSHSLMTSSRNRVIEQVKATARVPTPPVLQARGYVFQRLVASGAHSNLYQVVSYSLHNQELACKHIHKDSLVEGGGGSASRSLMMAFLEEETAIMERVKHRNIVRMLEIVTTSTDVYIIMNFAANGTIFDYLYKEWKKPLPETYARRWMRHLMTGLEYLHYSLRIVHRDLKLENFLLTEHYIALLSDFGLAVQLGQPQADRLLAVHCGTQDYMAPELNVTNHGGRAYHIDPLPADIYAMGVSLFEVLNSYRPFAISFSASSHSVLYRQQHRLYRLNGRVVLDPAARELLAELLEPKPSLRPTATAVLAHVWFRGQTAS